MTYNIKAYMQERSVILEPLSPTREWFEQSGGKMAYRCYPLSSANTIGWGIAFPDDISFIWDGERWDFINHVKILSGEKWFRVQDNGTIAFMPYFSLATDEDVTILINPVPNQFSDEWATISMTFSTGFYHDNIATGAHIMKANKIITIPAGTPVAAIIPYSLTKLKDTAIECFDWDEKDFSVYNDDYSRELAKYQHSEDFADFYRKGVNHKNEVIGYHEAKKLNLKTIDREK